MVRAIRTETGSAMTQPSRFKQSDLTRAIKAAEAVEMGLALRVVEGDVVEAAIALAEQIGANSPTAVSACKQIFNECREVRASEGMLLERSLFGACFETEDQTEGMSAFLEKRPAEFPGR